jgi:hypothetical protein
MSHSVEHDLRFTGTTFDENLLGFTKTFNVLDYITSNERPPTKFSAQCTAVFCKNVSNGTVAKGACVEPVDDDTYYFPFGTGPVSGDEELCVGVVSPFIAPATVADDAAFWLIIHGLTKVRYDGSADIDPGDPLSTAASGGVKVHVLGTDPEHCRIGLGAEDIASGSAGTLLWAYLNNLM